MFNLISMLFCTLDSPHSPTLKVVEKKTDLVKLSWSNKELKSDVVTGKLVFKIKVDFDTL